ncbi:hypothetical protein EVAR_43976_1 [Eumeta japonica]|uniref:Uncharacterized protein n=1 Tax=Eumeta variegata TaxID=151549 RepID=A0A4C1XCD1_EUMVA|nr:hypothetical protein EVAR_43976_1 [Eumeta japonica]
MKRSRKYYSSDAIAVELDKTTPDRPLPSPSWIEINFSVNYATFNRRLISTVSMFARRPLGGGCVMRGRRVVNRGPVSVVHLYRLANRRAV